MNDRPTVYGRHRRIEVQFTTPIVSEDERDEEDLELDGRDHEEVDGDKVLGVSSMSSSGQRAC